MYWVGLAITSMAPYAVSLHPYYTAKQVLAG